MLRALAFAAWALTAREPAEVLEVRDGLALDAWRARRVSDPSYQDAIPLAAQEVGRPELVAELWRVCKRESRCGQFGPVQVHEVDAWVGSRVHARAVARGLLDPDSCPAHRITAERPAREFATRGGFGQIAAYSIHRLGPCVAPEDLDDPRVAAMSAALAMVEIDPWGRPLRPTCEARLASWAGRGKVATWSPAKRRRRLARQCGPQPGLTPWEHLQDLVWPIVRHWRAWSPPPPPPSPVSSSTPAPRTANRMATTSTVAG